MPKDTTQIDKIKRDVAQQLQISHVVFSFKYLTNNKNYGMKSLPTGAHELLFSQLVLLSQSSLMKLSESPRDKGGYENIKLSMFKESFQGMAMRFDIISRDSTLRVFRFGQNKYRLITKPDINHQHLLYIIGFDTQYKAYSH